MFPNGLKSSAKLYLSIIDDVIDSVRELFLDEGVEDRVLDDLRHLWESKVMQSKAMEGLRKNTNPSNFVLQLPASYTQTDQELTVVIPGNQNIRSFPVKASTLATFSLPAGLAYPVQIPAGVTLQTASGQLYKVNVPVVVTQAPVGQQPATQAMQKVTEWREASAPQPPAIPPNPIPPHEVETSSVPAQSVTQPKTILPSSQEGSLPLQFSDIVQLDGPAGNSDLEEEEEVPLEENDFLGIINAEAMKDPLNSGDDVIEQDIPDLFDTDNVIVCQYDKIHRSKNRWKFHLKDGVMCYGGRDYVFSKAVGEAEW
uniref:General transcription factor IIA, 1-like n=1 Tax=Oreochromis niloticus TaxID=8128 RepID=A0A669F4V3_ORENI